MIFNLLPNKNGLTRVMDRTNWKFGTKNINILMLVICCKNVAYLLMFMALNKRGGSSIQVRIDLTNKYIECFGKKIINCLLADIDFVGDKWIKFLNDNAIRYHIRIRKNLKVYSYQ